MSRREKGTGSWDKVTKNGNTYYRFRKIYDNTTKEFTGKTKASVKEKIEAYEQRSMRVTNADYNKMSLGDCIDSVLSILEQTMKANNYATLRSTYRCYITTNPIREQQMGNIDKFIIQNYYNDLSKKYSESTEYFFDRSL